MEYVSVTECIDGMMEYEWDHDFTFLDLHGEDDFKAYFPNGKSTRNGESIEGICVVVLCWFPFLNCSVILIQLLLNCILFGGKTPSSWWIFALRLGVL